MSGNLFYLETWVYFLLNEFMIIINIKKNPQIKKRTDILTNIWNYIIFVSQDTFWHDCIDL